MELPHIQPWRFEVVLEQNYRFEVRVEKGLTKSVDSKSLEGSSTYILLDLESFVDIIIKSLSIT